MPPATYYTVSDRGYFAGTVAMVNSLHVTGNAGKVVVLDRGLTDHQRSALGSRCSLVRLEDIWADGERHPYLLKPFPYLLEASGSIVIIDGDMIVTQNLGAILERVDAGKICAFEDPTVPGRRFSQWETDLQLRAPLRQQTYVNAGFLAFSTVHRPDFLPRWWELCSTVLPNWEDDYNSPYYWRDQEALNALLMSEIPADALEVLSKSGAPAFRDLKRTRVVDARSLASIFDGDETVVLHNAGPVKPWDPRKWYRLQRNAYLKVMPRVLFADDLPVRIRPDDVPGWLRDGVVPGAQRAGLTLFSDVTRGVVDLLPPLRRFVRGRFRARDPGGH